MSAKPALLGSRPAGLASASSVRALPISLGAAAMAVTAIAFVALAALTFNAWGDLARDTGYDWVAAQRLLDGQLPYADFTYYYGPLGVMLLAGAFAVFGGSAGTAAGFGLVLAALAVALTYQLARELTGPVGAVIAAALAATAALATGNNGLVTPHTVSASTGVVVCLATLAAAAAYARNGRRSLLVLAGAGVGLASLTRPELFAGLAFALGLWLVLRIALAEDRGAELRASLWGVAAAAAVPLLAYGFVLTTVSAGALVNENLAPADEVAAGAGNVLKISAPMTIGSFAEFAARTALYATGAAALLGVAALYDKRRTLVRVAIVVVALGFLAALAVNPEAIRSKLSLAYGWIPAGAALATLALVWRARSQRGRWSTHEQAALLLVAFLTVFAGKNYGAFFPQPNAKHAQSALYALPFAGVFLVWLHAHVLPRGRGGAAASLGLAVVAALALAGFTLTAIDASKETATVSGPGGEIAAPASQAAAYQGALDAIAARTQPGEPILLAPQITALYTLAQRPDPLPEISLVPGALGSPSAEQQAVARLKDVRLVLTDRRVMPEYGHGAFGETYDRVLGAWLRTEFQRVSTFRGAGEGAVTLDLWQRSAS